MIKNIKRAIAIILIMIETIIIALLMLNKLVNKMDSIIIKATFVPCIISLTLLAISILIYIIEHKIINRQERIIDDETIQGKLDIDKLKRKDILYLSTVLTQQEPSKRQIILIIMQLITKKVLELSMYFDGKDYKYIIEKRKFHEYSINEVEQNVIEFIFKNENKVDLISSIQKIYKHKDSKRILNECKTYVNKIINIKNSPIKLIYKVIIYIVGYILLYVVSANILIVNITRVNMTSEMVTRNAILSILICIYFIFYFKHEFFGYNNVVFY